MPSPDDPTEAEAAGVTYPGGRPVDPRTWKVHDHTGSPRPMYPGGPDHVIQPGERSVCLLEGCDHTGDCPGLPPDSTEGGPRHVAYSDPTLADNLTAYMHRLSGGTLTADQYRANLGFQPDPDAEGMRRRKVLRDQCNTAQVVILTGALPLVCLLAVLILLGIAQEVW